VDDDSAVFWNAEIGVVSSNRRPPWPVLLGQIGFFDQFTVCMHRHAHATAIQPFGAFDETFGVT